MAVHSARMKSAFSGHQQPLVATSLCYHACDIEECLQHQGSSASGLSHDEVLLRQPKNLAADIDALRFRTLRRIVLRGLKTPGFWLATLAAAITFGLGDWRQGIAILVITGIYILMQSWLWRQTEQEEANADEQSQIRCQVRRQGKLQTIAASELVCGDVLIISSGQVVPADARLLWSEQLQVDESVLTGESILVAKDAKILLAPEEELQDQRNMVFAGTRVKTGKADALVIAIGKDTAMGQIAELSCHTQKRSASFAKRLDQLANRVFLWVAVLSAVLIALEFQRGASFLNLMQLATMMALAAFPESVRGFVGLIISQGMQHLRRKQVLVKHFQALEALGDVTVVCSDKTGTLTENHLIFDRMIMPELGAITYNPMWQAGEGIPHPSIEAFLRVARLNNTTVSDGLRGPLMGDPVDVALYRATHASLEQGYHPRWQIPFDTETMRSAAICETPQGELVAMIKGAPESVMDACQFYMRPDGSIVPLTLNGRMQLLHANRQIAFDNNLRIIGFAQKTFVENDMEPYQNAVFLGWVCLLDPPKPGVVEAIHDLKSYGIQLMMITGDQRATAEITARELGILSEHGEVWLRSELEMYSEQGQPIPYTVQGFARTKPEEKLAIVECLQRSGQVVAMIGDGVNDSPALQKSDVAIAMGRQGSKAAKDSSDIILLDDRLQGVILAVQESQRIYQRIQTCILYLLTGNMGLVFFMAAALISGYGLPLNPIQILWLNLVVAWLPTWVLAIDPSWDDVESGTWQRFDPLEKRHWLNILRGSVWIAACGLITFLSAITLFNQTPLQASALTLFALAMAQTCHLMTVQQLQSARERNVWKMPINWLVMGGSIILQLGAIYGLHAVIGVAPPAVPLLLLPAGLAASGLLLGYRQK